MAREKVSFRANEVYQLTFAAEPKQVDGKLGQQMQCIWEGERISWLDNDLWDVMLNALDLREGEYFTGRTIEIAKTTRRVDGEQQAHWEVTTLTSRTQPAPRSASPAATPAARSTGSQARGAIASGDLNIQLAASIMSQAMHLALACWLDVTAAAKAEGVSLRFEVQDLRATAATLFIKATEHQAATQQQQQKAA